MKVLSSSLISKLKRIDWDFSDSSSNSKFAAWHWHPSRFLSQIPAILIGLLSSPGDTVLDPFVGSGTTLVEAQRLGRYGIGIEINPVGCEISMAKSLSIRAVDVAAEIDEIIADTEMLFLKQLDDSSVVAGRVPKSVQLSKWYTRKVGFDLDVLWNKIGEYQSSSKSLLAQASFSSILLPCCREIRHWGYVCDNSTPKSDRGRDVRKMFMASLQEIRKSYLERDQYIEDANSSGCNVLKSTVIQGDARALPELLPDESVDLIVTSPPYFGVSDYIKSQRLSMEWFGKEIEEYRKQEIGARSKRHRQQAATQYLEEMKDSLAGMRRVLRQGKVCVLVVGESSKRESVIEEFLDAAKQVGFRVAISISRRVSDRRRQTPMIKNELIIFLD